MAFAQRVHPNAVVSDRGYSGALGAVMTSLKRDGRGVD